MNLRLLIVAWALASAFGCVLDAGYEGQSCGDRVCPAGQSCIDDVCRPRSGEAPDAASPGADAAVDPPPDAAPLQSLELRVADGADDAEENADGSMYITSTDLELTEADTPQTIGIRYPALAVPQGATIASAYVQFEVDETTDVETSLLLQAEAVDDAAAIGDAIGELSERPTTEASVEWQPEPWPTTDESGPDQRTPDLAPIVQEVVDRSGWSGGALLLIITGTGKRVADAYEGDPQGAPLLLVEYR